jgi:hypothetical protein
VAGAPLRYLSSGEVTRGTGHASDEGYFLLSVCSLRCKLRHLRSGNSEAAQDSHFASEVGLAVSNAIKGALVSP